MSELVEQLCAEAVKAYRLRDRTLNDVTQDRLNSFATGQMDGLRIALCVLNGWDVQQESDKEGKADELVLEHWQKHFPEDWS